MERHTDLPHLINYIWDQIEHGATDPAHPYHTPTFGSIGNEGPSLRTIVLRSADRHTRSLLFHSDRRAKKISEIANNSNVTWHFWNSDTREQLRLKGTATVHIEDEIADDVWQTSRPSSLVIYVKPTPPGTVVDRPLSGIVQDLTSGELSKESLTAGRPYFAVVCTRIDEIDFVQLHNEGNYRALFQWNSQEFVGSWVIP